MDSRRLVKNDHFLCDVCRQYVYDEYTGDAEMGVLPLTCIGSLPLTWKCPICGASKDRLRPSTLLDAFTHEGSGNYGVHKRALERMVKAAH